MTIPVRLFEAFKDEWPRIALKLNSTMTLRGALADRPETHEGLYIATDTNEVIFFDGAAWRRVADNTLI